jgi:bifunctional non-homologous end joining protein LigD
MKNGVDLQDLPLADRKAILAETVQDNNFIQKIHFTTDGLKLWDIIMQRKLEGVVCKNILSTYQFGKRSESWLKIKNIKTVDCLIAGYTLEERSQQALVLAAWYKGQMRFLGKVSTGVDDALMQSVMKKTAKAKLKLPGFFYPPHYKGIQWVKPTMPCEIEYVEFGADGILNSPVFLKMRNDKPSWECRLELPKSLINSTPKKAIPLANWSMTANKQLSR